MSGFKGFAVAGAGNFGKFIVKELLELKNAGKITKVSVLTRSAGSATSSELAALGASIVELDYGSTDSIIKALAGVDVLICAFGPTGISTQISLAEPAKAAGVKLFVPSEYGGDSEQLNKISFQVTKLEVQKKLKEIKLPYTLFQTGGWPDACFTPFFGFDLANAKVKFGGSGDAPISWTGKHDAARFIAHALTAFPKDNLEWKSIRFEGDRQSLNSVVAQYEKKKGTKVDITRRSREELEASLKENPNDFLSLFFLAWDLGGGVLGDPKDLANGDWPEWNPKKVIDIIA